MILKVIFQANAETKCIVEYVKLKKPLKMSSTPSVDIEVDEPLIIDDLYGHLPNQIHLVKNMMKILMCRKIILELRGDQSL